MLMLMLSVSGCGSTSPEIRLVKVHVCDGLEPLMVSKDDVLTDGTIYRLLALNCKILACKKIEHEACKTD